MKHVLLKFNYFKFIKERASLSFSPLVFDLEYIFKEISNTHVLSLQVMQSRFVCTTFLRRVHVVRDVMINLATSLSQDFYRLKNIRLLVHMDSVMSLQYFDFKIAQTLPFSATVQR